MGEQFMINCVGRGATIGGGWPAGAYLGSYDPEANDGWGDASWTPDPAKALVFDSAAAAFELYKAIPANRPVRPDGNPNRPLTALGIELVPVTVQAHGVPSVTGRTVADIFRDLDLH